MENSTGNPSGQGDASFPAGENVKTFFIYHLNRIYAAKLRMAEVLDELLARVAFTDLAVAVRVTLNLIRDQVASLEEIYAILAISPSLVKPNELLNLMEEGYLATGQHQPDTHDFDLAVLAFLQNSESLELASFKVLQHAALELKNSFISGLLDQSVAGSEADYELLVALMTKQLNNL